jgi:hypothetical protein
VHRQRANEPVAELSICRDRIVTSVCRAKLLIALLNRLSGRPSHRLDHGLHEVGFVPEIAVKVAFRHAGFASDFVDRDRLDSSPQKEREPSID